MPRERAAGQVTIAAFTPTFDESHGDGKRGAWYCDIDVEAGEAYMPFVRLALVRYQPNSLEGCLVSNIVTADIVQTLPDRTLTVVKSGSNLAITVAGPTYTAIKGLVPRSDDAALGRVVARLENRDPSVPDPVLSWRPLPSSETALVRTLSGNVAAWTGTILVPEGDRSSMRLAIIEEDYLATEVQEAGQPDLAARVVYADVLGL
jgi:hypothetical protein